MIFFVRVALAVAHVESHLAHQGYYDTKMEQMALRLSEECFAWCKTRNIKIGRSWDEHLMGEDEDELADIAGSVYFDDGGYS